VQDPYGAVDWHVKLLVFVQQDVRGDDDAQRRVFFHRGRGSGSGDLAAVSSSFAVRGGTAFGGGVGGPEQPPPLVRLLVELLPVLFEGFAAAVHVLHRQR